MKNNYSTTCHIKIETLILKKTKIGDMIINNNVAPNNAHINWKTQPHKKLLHNNEEQLFYSMPHKNGDTNFLKKSKIRDMIMNNNVAPNNALLCDI